MAVASAVGLIESYQRFLSPFLPRACRFFPSCSEYAKGALRVHGFFRGTWLAGQRICRCQPFSAGGYDPPPVR
ncbi:MAG TPA: membrane protein insertion efficiency factor YidD [Methylomirabilota bacterium]|nr:membrane protein insertion efficiency factor YidD [Methylomirabilota bacterium]